MYQRILVPLDGSDTSLCGLREAIHVAQGLKSRIRLLHVVKEHVLDTGYCIGTYEGDLVHSLRTDGENLLRDAVVLTHTAGLIVDQVMVESNRGSIARSILKQAKSWSADLIVMGTHGRHALSRVAMGSDAEAVVRESGLPVLLVRCTSQQANQVEEPGSLRDAGQDYVYA